MNEGTPAIGVHYAPDTHLRAKCVDHGGQQHMDNIITKKVADHEAQ